MQGAIPAAVPVPAPVFVIETIMGRNKIAICEYASQEAAVAHLCDCARDLLPKYRLRAFEKAADIVGFDVCPKEITPDVFATGFNGFSFDHGRYCAFLSRSLSFDFRDQELLDIPGRPQYWHSDPFVGKSLAKADYVFVVSYDFTYGDQGVGTSLGVFSSVDVAVCELWRDTYGRLEGRRHDCGGYGLVVDSVTPVFVGDEPSPLNKVALKFFSEWEVKPTSDEWVVFRHKVTTQLRDLFSIDDPCYTAVKRASRVRVTTYDTVQVSCLDEGNPVTDMGPGEYVQSEYIHDKWRKQFDVFVDRGCTF